MQYIINAAFFINIFIYDINFYITHILLHKYAYHIHTIHHDSYNILSWRTTYKAHIIENILQNYVFLVLYMYGSKHIILAYLYISIRGLLNHEPRCRFIFNNHHINHHKYRNCNYGEYYIDYLCNTLHNYDTDQQEKLPKTLQ